MHRRTVLIAASTALIASRPATAAEPKTLELFGVALKGAEREGLRAVLKKEGLRPIRESDRHWYDIYSAERVLEGATELGIGYSKAGAFAVAVYTFPSLMDTQQVGKVVDMVAHKYGRPTSARGRYELGPVTVTWNLAQGTKIEVYRDWPNTTTYLYLIDSRMYDVMQAEMDADKKTQDAQKSKAQSKAF